MRLLPIEHFQRKNVLVCTHCESTLKEAWFVLCVLESPVGILIFIKTGLKSFFKT